MTATTSSAWLTDRRRILIGRAMAIAALSLALTGLMWYLWRQPAALYQDWILHNLGGALTLAVLGWLLVQARPRSRVAWLFPWMAFFQSLQVFGGGLLVWLNLPTSGAIPVDDLGLAGWIGYLLIAAAWIPGVAPMVTLALLWFPDGELPSPRWRVVEWTALISIAATTVVFGVAYRPVGGAVSVTVPAFVAAALAALLVSVVLSLAGLVVRYRRSRGAERRRYRWIAWSTGLTAVAIPASLSVDAVVFDEPGGPVARAVMLAIVFVFFGGYAIAIWRHQLFDIDLVISRTLMWGSLATFIGAAYIAVVFGVGSLVGRSSGDSAALSLAATALVAFLFQPVRRRLEYGANRLVFGHRATPYEVLADLSRRLTRTESTDGLLERMVTLLADGVAAETAVVWRRIDDVSSASNGSAVDRYEPLAVYPHTSSSTHRTGPEAGSTDGSDPPLASTGEEWIAIERAGVRLGALSVTKRKGEDLTPIERRLVEDLAGSAGLVLDRARLDAALATQADALVRSRRRLVEAQTEERHRLQQRLQSDTHPHLDALAAGLEQASEYAAADGVEAITSQLAALAAEIRLAMDEINTLARGMYPPVLESRGLPAAIEALAAGLPLSVDIRSAVTDRFDLEVEQAVYFTVGEALTNVVKHAEATAASVDLDLRGERLVFEVVDDGRGFEPGFEMGAGTGLVGLRDRLDTVGGTLTVDSASGRGTKVSGSVPAVGANNNPNGTGSTSVATVDRHG